jgi:hypothetical protein
MTPWRLNARAQHVGRSALEWFLWLNTLWAIMPAVILVRIATGEVSWLAVVALYVAALLALHSVIAHSADAALRRWLHAPPPDA